MSFFKKTLIVLALTASGAIVGGIGAVGYITSQSQITGSIWTLMKLSSMINANYVDNLSEDEVKERMLSGIVDSLDPHSSYLNPKDLRDMQEKMQAEYGGIGVTAMPMENDKFILIEDLHPDGPAKKSGLQKGDKITHVNDKKIGPKSFESIRGPIGSKITLTVERDGKTKGIEVERQKINIPTVQWGTFSDTNSTAVYIKARQFNEQIVSEVIQTLEKQLELSKPRAVVLDLRDNPGGLVTSAVGLAALFLPENKTVLISKSSKSDKEELYKTTPYDWGHFKSEPDKIQTFKSKYGETLNSVPLYVLLNQNSASASELLAAAFKDHKRATIVGTPSFGKGSVQTLLPFDNGAIKLTTSRYYSPSGNAIQAKGVEPDILVEDPDEIVGLRESDLPGHLPAEQGAERSGVSTALSKKMTDKRIAQIKEKQKKEISIFVRHLDELPQDPVLNKVREIIEQKQKF